MKKNKKRTWIFLLTIFFSTVYLIWRTCFTIPWNAGMWQAAAGTVLVLAEMVTMLGMFELMVSKMRYQEQKLIMPDMKGKEYPDIDVLIATHNEPADLLFKTVNACMFLEYPDTSKVHVYVCDDGNREEIRKMTESLGAGYIEGMKKSL